MPRIVYWVAGLLGIAQLIGIILILLTPPDSTNTSVVRFDQASRCMEIPLLNPINSEGIAAMLDHPIVTQDNCWQPVTLPKNNSVQDAKVDLLHGYLVRTWYRVQYQVPSDWPVTKPLMVYVPRIIANAWQIRIAGQVLTDNRVDWRSTWNRPVSASFFSLPEQRGKTIDIEIGVIASKAEGFSISRITTGDPSAISRAKAFRDYLQVIMPQASGAVMLLLSMFFLSFWFARRSEKEYLFLAFASLAFAVMNTRFTFTMTYDADLDFWYNALMQDIPVPWLHCLTFLFLARMFNFSYPWLEKLLWLEVIIMSLISLLPISLQYDLSILKNTFGLLIVVVSDFLIILQAIVNKIFTLRIIAVLQVFGIIAGFHDLALSMNLINPEQIYLAPYSMLASLAGYLFTIQRRYVNAINSQEQLNVDLARRLVEREELTQRLTESEAELRTQQNRLLALERSQTLAEERQRLMHDMHDGLGSSLLTTLAAIEKDNLPQEAVADALRVCIEDLRLVIDSLDPVAHDLVTLLATIRYRLGQRLDAAGLELLWEIGDLPPLPWMEPPDALNVLRLVQEALVNVLKHAKATSIRVATRNLGHHVEIQIEDNGCGFDPKTITPGRGMHSQTRRTERLGGELQIESTPGRGTLLHLQLPISKA